MYNAAMSVLCSYKEFSGIAALVERVFCWDFLQGNMEGPAQPRVSTKLLAKTTTKFITVRQP
jgi:hypothetical protein